MPTFDYPGKCVLVTGAGRGLGFAVAKAFHAAGATVVLNDRSADVVELAARKLGGNVIAAAADLATPEGCAAAVAPARQIGRLDILVNNAAINVEQPIGSTSDAHWDMHLAVVLRAPFFIAQEALALFRNGDGCIINIASELGLHAIPNNVAYVAAKHGVVAMTRAMAMELAPLGIRVNAVCPGTMDTELMQECALASGDAERYYDGFRRYHPLGRLASPQEIAQFILCLASPAAGYMTGAVLAIDGGSSAGRR